MKKFTPSQFKSIFLVIFCALSFLASNAQRREERRQQNNRPDRIQSAPVNHQPVFSHQPPRVNADNAGPERHPPINYNHNQPPEHIAGPANNSQQHFPQVNRDFRNDRANANRGGYFSNNDRYNNERYRYHYDRFPRYNAHNPSWRYGYLPARHSIIREFPFGYQTYYYGGFGYRYYNGAYYRPYNDAFIVCAPPFGLSINFLPFGYRRIYVDDYPYYYYNGTYYDQSDDGYKVVAPPVGAVVESLPQGYETVVIDGETYYNVDGVQYKPVVQDNGEIWYQVIKVN